MKQEELLKNIAGNIKSKRKLSGLSQFQLANKCETAQSYIGEIESCKKNPSLKMIAIIADKLAVEPYQLLLSENDLRKIDRIYFNADIANNLATEINRTVSNVLSEYIDE